MHEIPQPILYSDKDKWFFIHIPKNGGTAVTIRYTRNENLHQEDGIQKEHVSLNEKHNTTDFFIDRFPKFKDYTPICLVRNPWDRCLSYYTFHLKICLKDENFNKEFSRYIHPRLTREGFKGAWMPGGFWRDEDNMQSAIDNHPGRLYKDNWPQSRWLNENSKFFKLETQLEEMYDFMKIPIKRNAKFPDESNWNSTKHHEYRLYYDEELKNEIGELYKEDIEKFGYTF